MLLGKVLAEAAMKEGKFVTWLPAYGAEVRGGTAYCMVVISDAEIGSPYIAKADTLLAMNQPSLDKFKGRLAAKGILIVNSSLAKTGAKGSASVLKGAFSELAAGLGNIKVANMAALGCYIAAKKIVKLATAIKVIEEIAPDNKKELIEINKQPCINIKLLKR